MNTKMLMLGILLLAGLSFASIEPNWMMYAADKYGCSYDYYGKGWDEGAIGLSDIVNKYYTQCERPGCWDTNALDSYRKDMDWAVWDEGEEGMCAYSGCPGWGRPSANAFRSSMLEFNVAASGYRAEFLAGLRAYLSNGGSRAGIIEDLVDARDDHLACLAYVREEGPCAVCRVDEDV